MALITKPFSEIITFTRPSTATYFDALGVMRTAAANEPRIDYDPATGKCKGFLIEGAATNLLRYSEDFSNSAWGKSQASIVPDASAAPDGTMTADKFVWSAGTSTKWLTSSTVAFTAGTQVTLSVYVEDAGEHEMVLRFNAPAFGAISATSFNLANKTASYTSGNIQAAGVEALPNGWFRCWVTATPTTTAEDHTYVMACTDGSQVATGDGVSGLYIWGAQFEAGSLSSYIPTEASQVTRAADNALMTGANFSSWYRQDEGTFIVDYMLGYKLGGIRVLSVSDGTGSNYMEVVGASGAASAITSGPYLYGAVGGVTGAINASNAITNIPNSRRIAAIAYKENDFASTSDGRPPALDTSGNVPSVDRAQFSNSVNHASSLVNGHIQRITYYPRRLTNEQLIELTS